MILHYKNNPKILMAGLKYIIFFILVGFLLTAARPLVCWKIGFDMQWHRAKCWSTEFEVSPAEPIWENPTEIPAEPTWIPELIETQTEISTPMVNPYPVPELTRTAEPYPVMESQTWGGIEPAQGWWK